jgi:hypothetical protein
MYAWIWRHLPGDWRVKSATAAGLALVVVLILWYAVFPWLEERLRFDHGVVQNGTPGHSGSPSPGPSGSATPDRG